jgi:membrane protease YdiL (CAAX protease family)
MERRFPDLPKQYFGINQSGTSYSPKNPLLSILFSLPLLVIYEIGIAFGALGETINGADWIFRILWNFFVSIIGQTISLILFGFVIAILVAYVVMSRRELVQQFRFRFLAYMTAESIGFGFFLAVFIFLGLNGHLPTFFSFEQNIGVASQAAAGGLTTQSAMLVASIGAGIFEELLFRVIILRMLFLFFTQSQRVVSFEDNMPAFLKATLISSAIFALMHIGSLPNLLGLIPIFLGSIAFSFIYAKRGYGVAAGAHIIFDACLLFGIIT